MVKNKFGVIVNVGIGALRGRQGRGGEHDDGGGARIREAGHPRAVDLAGPDQDAVPGRRHPAASPERYQKFLDDIRGPLRRARREDRELVLFMCSDACTFMTADTVYVNGGGGWR